MTLVAFRMSNRRVLYGFIQTLILIQIGGSLNPDDRITGLEKELSFVKTDLDILKSQVIYLKSMNQELLPLGTIIPWVNRPALDSQQSVEKLPKGWQR